MSQAPSHPWARHFGSKERPKDCERLAFISSFVHEHLLKTFTSRLHRRGLGHCLGSRRAQLVLVRQKALPGTEDGMAIVIVVG